LAVFFSGLFYLLFRIFRDTEPTLAYVLLTLGICCGLLIPFFYWQNHLLGKSTDSITEQEFLKVGTKFRSKFTNEVRLLRERYHEFGQKPDFKTTHDVVKSALEKHELAWLNFRELLTDTNKLARLDHLWMKYSYQHKTAPGDPFWGYKVPQKCERKLGTIPAENKVRDYSKNIQYV